MSAFDQAFIKAYAQPDATPATRPAGPVQRMSLVDALKGQLLTQTTRRPAGPPLADSPDVLPGTPAGTANPAPIEQWVERAGDAGEDRFRQPLRPMLQVDALHWPQVCRRAHERASDELDRLADRLVAGIAVGQRVLAMGSCCQGEGATTLLLCTAQRLAQRGLKVALVDANLSDPQLAKRLGLQPEFGWEEILAGRLPLEEVVIESTGTPLALLPACQPFEGARDPAVDEARMADTIALLAAHYDLVLVDLGGLEDPEGGDCSPLRALAGRLDAVVLVHNVRATAVHRLAAVQHRLATVGISQLGVIRNFIAA